MNEKKNSAAAVIPLTEKRMLSLREASAYVGLGISRARELCERAGVVRNFGRRVLIDRVKLDAFLSQDDV